MFSLTCLCRFIAPLVSVAAAAAAFPVPLSASPATFRSVLLCSYYSCCCCLLLHVIYMQQVPERKRERERAGGKEAAAIYLHLDCGQETKVNNATATWPCGMWQLFDALPGLSQCAA